MSKKVSLTFFGWFFAFMILISGIQIALGVFQLPHSSEAHLHSGMRQTDRTNIPNKLSKIEENRTQINSYIASLDQDSAQELVEKLNYYIEKYAQDIETFRLPSQEQPTTQNPGIPVREGVEISEKTKELAKIQIEPKNSTMPAGYSQQILSTLEVNYFQKTLMPFDLIIDNEREEPRGQMQHIKRIVLSGNIQSLTELSKVFVHELAHIVDIYVFKKGRNDPSKDFYAISWESRKVKTAQSRLDDFISGYASTDQYEDFAESFTFFIFHNEAFQKKAEQNSVLQQKYDFLKNRVFQGEFLGTALETQEIPDYIWDTTKVEISQDGIKKLLATLATMFEKVV